MRARDDDPPVALAGWGPGGSGMLTARGADLLARADRIFVEGAVPGFGSRDPRASDAPRGARSCAEELGRAARSGVRTVWLAEGDPLELTSGRDLARWLTATGVAWEYAPAAAPSTARPGAVAHLSRRAVAASDAEWEAWRTAYPLLGLTVAVTRAEPQAAPLLAALAERGADPVACPTIAISEPSDPSALDGALRDPGRYDWAIFTSANGVDRFFARMAALDGDIRDLKGVRLAAIGPATAASLSARGLRVDLVPDEYVAEALFVALEREGRLSGARILVARAAVARDVLPDALRASGAEVDVVEAYQTVLPDASRDLVAALVDNGVLDLATFTSSSTVTNFVALAGPDRAQAVRAACIGPVTAATARAAGLDVAVEAEHYTTGGLVDAIVRLAQDPSPEKGFETQ